MSVRGRMDERTRLRLPRLRLPRPRPSVTVPIALLTLVGGITFVHVADGAAATLQTRPQQAALAVPTRAVATPTRPVCRHIVHLGDSNLAIASRQFEAAYTARGIDAVVDTGLGRGAFIVKTGTTALDAIHAFQQSVPASGRCWILELGAEDAFDAAVHHTDPTIAITAMADAVGDEPTMWITPVLTSTVTDYSIEASNAYNRALLEVVADRPNITVFDWQDIALQHLDQFQPDGVHYKQPLYDELVQKVLDEAAGIWRLSS